MQIPAINQNTYRTSQYTFNKNNAVSHNVNQSKQSSMPLYDSQALKTAILSKISFGSLYDDRLNQAIKENNLEKVREILNGTHLININAYDEKGYTPLQNVFRYPEDDAVEESGRATREEILKEILKQKDIDVNKLSEGGEAALHLATDRRRKYPGYVHILLQHPDIDVNVVTSITHETPLFYTISEGNHEIAKELVSHPDINTRILDYQGRDAFSLTEEDSYDEPIIQAYIVSGPIDFKFLSKQNNKGKSQ